jgi:acetylornithine deacetylase/succinyl-diaminopimelate desuccinylase-like protein
MVALRRFRSAAVERAIPAGERACAEWFVEELRDIGFSASVRDTPGQPITLGHDRASRGPSVLFCGHYETLTGLWRGKRGNGAGPSTAHHLRWSSTDQSVQLMAFIEACRAWKAVAGQLPMPVSVLIEGEGRSGSTRLTSFMRMYADELKADIGLAPGIRIWCCAVPAINSMLRGVCCEEFTISPDPDQPARRRRDGIAADPSRILANILSDLHDPSGRVAIPGFYAGVETSHDVRGCASGTTDPPSVDVPVPEGDPGDVHVEAPPVWATCEIDSFSGSRTIRGQRFATSPRAWARLAFHLVYDQNPDAVRRAFRDFALARIPPGSRIEFTSGISVPPVSFTTSHPGFRKVLQALTAEWGSEAVFTSGDAALAVHALCEALGMAVIVTSFPERPDGCAGPRGPSELANYQAGIRSWVRILGALAR